MMPIQLGRIFVFLFAVLCGFQFPLQAQGQYDWKRTIDFSEASSSEDSLFLLMPYFKSLNKNGDFVQLVDVAPHLEQIAQRANNDTLRQTILINHSFALRAMSRFEEALRVAEYGLTINGNALGRLGLMSTQATSLGEMGKIDQTMAIFDDIIAISRKNSYTRQEAAALNNKAIFLKNAGKMTEALEAFEFAVEIGKVENDTTLIAMGLSNIGEILFRIEDLEPARFYLNQSLDLARQQQNIPNMLIPLTNLGYVALKENNFERADSIFSEVFNLSKNSNDPLREMRTKYNYGKSLAEKDEFARAEPLLKEVVTAAQTFGIPIGQAFAHTELARIYLKQQHYAKAISSSSKALDLAEQLSNTQLIQTVLGLRYQAYKKQGVLTKAFVDLERFSNMNDSLFSENREQLLAEQRVKLETQKKQFDIEALEATTKIKNEELKNQRYLVVVLIIVSILIATVAFSYFVLNRNKRKNNNKLRRLNEELNIQSKKFQEANQDKNKLLSILAHDLRTPFNSIRMLVDYIKGTFQEPGVSAIIVKIEEDLQIESSTVDNLLEWATKYHYALEPEILPYSLKELMDEVLQQQLRITELKSISIQNTCTDTCTIEADRNLFQAVLRNLLSNAIKFSPTHSTIYLSCQTVSNHVIISVRDQGVGMSKKVQQRLFTTSTQSSAGTNNESGTGLGLSLSKEFVEKMHGRLEFSSKEGEGTTFKVVMPGKAV